MKKVQEKRKDGGITLIALVITIIVLLILAGITINLTLGENGILIKSNEARENTRGANVKEQVELWKGEKRVNKYYGTTNLKSMTEKELLDDLELNQKNLSRDERITLETTRKVTIGNQTITLDKIEQTPLTSIYAKLYTDGTLILSSFDYTDENREVQEDYKDIAGKEYGFSNGEPYGDFPGWFEVEYNYRYESYEMLGTKCDKVIIKDRIAPTNMNSWFRAINEIIGIENLDTSHVTDMGYMFFECNNLTNLDVSKFDTSNVTDMGGMFDGCKNLTNLDVSKFDTSNVTDMGGMFNGCNNLTNLDVSKFDTSNVTDMGGMFNGCKNLTNLDVSKFNTSNVTRIGYMFEGCNNLTTLNINNFSFNSIKDDATQYRGTRYMFANCIKLNELGVDVLNLEGINRMESMFENCASLKNIKLKGSRENKYCRNMFKDCVELENVELEDGFLNNVEGVEYIFANCKKLRKALFGQFHIDRISKFEYMFNMCENLEEIDMSFGEFESAIFDYSFYGCSNLRSVKLPKGEWASMNYTFSNCSKLCELEVNIKRWGNDNNLEQLKILEVLNTFENCTSLSEIDLTCLEHMVNKTKFSETFKGCTALQHVYVNKTFNYILQDAFVDTNISDFTVKEN